MNELIEIKNLNYESSDRFGKIIEETVDAELKKVF